ncbi:ubiquinone-binding protein COQ10 [Pneumocystis jirovecii RU7]|uniref:Coenzyme Q-binding protein COQ10 START domain-containing protein n=1 Tax=Pneumocystis jirovecii (strain RU7) TaxID=1408657 RepID=A0A0W4ZUR9_PNEJ7|nr:ubiquinone-binding protein COQ10 [Pneumocystis jirovecii RU7]KTW32123.1 hypothetical protein T551_00805 [Pneumocystis jirovecii RU7]
MYILHSNGILFQKKINLKKIFIFKFLLIQKHSFLNSTNKSEIFSTYRILQYKKSLVFSVISDVDSYSTFIPYCLTSKVTKRNKDGLPQTADLRIGWKKYDEIFTSEISYLSYDCIIVANASNHPLFHKLQATWYLKDIKTANSSEKKTKISLILNCKFSNPLHTMISIAAIPTISTLIINAFETRIKHIAKAS